LIIIILIFRINKFVFDKIFNQIFKYFFRILLTKVSNKNNKPVLQYTKDGEFIKEWKSAKEVCRHFNITSIHRSLISWNNNSKGFKWKFKNKKI
jgi:hypothetical protein